MVNEIELSEKFEPLYKLLDGDYKDVDLVIVTGGRLGSKSYGVSTFIAEAFIQFDWQTLYTRFTNVSGKDSTIPEFAEKLELLNYRGLAKETGNRFDSLCGNGKVVFKGLKAGSAIQSANLKSLKDFNCWVNDESEEIPSYEVFRKIFLSIRSIEKRNLTILILNPTTKDFWIHEKFFKPNNIQDGFNGVVDRVMYIHTTYLDVPRKFIPDNIYNYYQELKVKSPDEYNYTILGGWLTDVKGAVFLKNQFEYFSLKDINTDNIEARLGAIDVADEGLDALSFPLGYLIGGKFYVTDWLFTTENTEYTIPKCTELTLHNKLDYLAIETNNMGGLFLKDVQKGITTTSIIPVHQSSNKHTRIIQNAYFIRNYLVFRNDYEPGSDYDKAMKQMFMYTKDAKYKKDDAPDSIALLSALIRDLFQSEF